MWLTERSMLVALVLACGCTELSPTRGEPGADARKVGYGGDGSVVDVPGGGAADGGALVGDVMTPDVAFDADGAAIGHADIGEGGDTTGVDTLILDSSDTFLAPDVLSVDAGIDDTGTTEPADTGSDATMVDVTDTTEAVDGTEPDTASLCPEVPAPSPVPQAPLQAMTPTGATETTTAGGFTDDWLYDGTGLTKVGTRREWGSTIVFLGLADGSPGTNGTNTIDANDTGREVQVALYDPSMSVQGCAWNASCLTAPGTACPNSITYLGWNPVQGGNECNHGSGTETQGTAGGVLEAEVRPLFWNPDWQVQGCGNGGCSDPTKSSLESDVRYDQRLRFVQPLVVEMQMTITNLSGLTHAPTNQEFPTLYASFGKKGPDLRVLLTSDGTPIAIDQPANDGFFHKELTSPGGWVALQNDAHDYGVGIYYENRMTSYQGWQKLGVFNNVRALFPFGLGAFGVVRARAYLMVGSFETIAGLASGLDATLPPFGALDQPTADQSVGGGMTVSGWVLDNKGVVTVEALVDGVVAGSLPVAVNRPDVCQTWPGYGMCDKVGFSGTVDLSGATACAHLLEIRATDDDGNQRVIARARVFVGEGPVCSDAGCDDGDPCTVDACGASGCAHVPVAPGEGPPEVCNGVDDDCDGVVDPGCGGGTHPVYRYQWSSGEDKDHAHGLSAEPLPGYAYEGVAFQLFDGPGAGKVPVYQSWCAACTDHLPSTTPDEGAPDYGAPVLLGYCSVAKNPGAPTEIRRLYGEGASDHFLTSDTNEWETAQGLGYVLEWGCWVP